MLKKIWLSPILIALALLLHAAVPFATDTLSVQGKEDKFEIKGDGQSVIITSDRLEGDTGQNVVRFVGNVIARRGDLTLCSESISIIYDRESKSVKELVAEGGVKIIQRNRTATGEKAVFVNAENKIILTGNPKVWEGANIIKGARITLFLAEDRGVVEADENTRVNATIFLSKSTEEKQGIHENITD